MFPLPGALPFAHLNSHPSGHELSAIMTTPWRPHQPSVDIGLSELSFFYHLSCFILLLDYIPKRGLIRATPLVLQAPTLIKGKKIQ